MTMHAGELPISAAVVRDLVGAQFPQWRGLPVSQVDSPGTVNAIFRLGDKLAARFPLRTADPAAVRRALESEAAAARELAAATRFPVPEQVAVGEPGPGYPLPWSVQAWLPGRTGDEDDPAGSEAFAADLAEFIAGVRAIGPRGRVFDGRGRGGDLEDHDAWMSTCFRKSEGLLDVRRLSLMWAAFRELPREAPDVMSHGDLTPGNVLVAGGRLAGVIDVGSFGAADPALDLISAWNLLESGPRRVLRAALRCTDLEWERSQAWAFQQAMGLVWYYAESNPVMSRLGRTTLARIEAAHRALPARYPASRSPYSVRSVSQCRSSSAASYTGMSATAKPWCPGQISTVCGTPASVSTRSSSAAFSSVNPPSSMAPATYTAARILSAARCGLAGSPGTATPAAWNEAAAAILSPTPPAATIASRPPMQYPWAPIAGPRTSGRASRKSA
jgi:aminoglycoside phosphotransferase (APT) family kinase protein